MALTTTEQEKLKKIIAKEDKAERIAEVNKIALASIKVKQDEIKAIDDKRNADIQAINDE